MNIYEHQAKEIFQQYGIKVPRRRLVENFAELKEAYAILSPSVVLKAQILGGGRGKAGGIYFASSLPEVEAGWSKLKGSALHGQEIKKLLLEEKVGIIQEFYLGITISPDEYCPVVLISSHGGIDVETISKEHGNFLAEAKIDPCFGLHGYVLGELINRLGIDSQLTNELSNIGKKLYQIFRDYRATLVEINPLALTQENELVAVDARLALDDNAVPLYVHLRQLKASMEQTVEDALKQKGIDYVELNGNIGIISVGAGETMATMDLVSREGGVPACFLDFSGGVNTDSIETALRTVSAREEVKAVLFNIFGGLTRIDLVADGFLRAWQRIGGTKQPVVIRVEGTNSHLGKEALAKAGFDTCATLLEAVKLVVELGKEG